MAKTTERMIRLIGLQDAADRLIALGSRIPESMFPDWFAESRNMLAAMRTSEAKLVEKLRSDELRQFVFIASHESPKTLQKAIDEAKKILSVPLKGKTDE